MRTIGLAALASFHAVARRGGISAAAEQLGLAKSGVSRHVAQLESHLAVKLLERGARSVRLTPVGERLAERIGSILAEVDLLHDIAREESRGIEGHVTVAATPELGSLIATRLFPALRRQHPALRLVVRPGYPFEDMQDPGTDLAFRVGEVKDDRLVARELGAFRFHLVAAPHVADAHPVLRPEDLARVPCLTFRGDRPESTWFLSSGSTGTSVEVQGPIAVRSFTTLLELAVAGEGYAFLPDFMLGAALDDRRLVRCLPDHVSRTYPVYLTFRSGARRVARIDAVVTVAEALFPGVLNA